MLQGFKPVAVNALFIERSDHALDHAVLLRAVRGDELLAQPVAFDQCRVAAAGEHHHSWTSKQNRCTGRFCIQAYSPYGVLNWSKQWREDRPGQLLGKVKAIAKDLIDFAPELVRLYEQAEQQAEIERLKREEEWRRWQAEERARKLQEAQIKSKEALLASIDHWAKVKAMDAFFEDVELRARLLPNEAEREAILASVQQAREVIGTTDALAYFKNWHFPT